MGRDSDLSTLESDIENSPTDRLHFSRLSEDTEPCLVKPKRYKTTESSLNSFGSVQRKLKLRHVQFISFGSAIGTVHLVTISIVYAKGGPGSFLLAFLLWCAIMPFINRCYSRLVCLNPISSPIPQFASRFGDDALGFVVALNYFIYNGFLLAFEMVGIYYIISYWNSKTPFLAVFFPCVLLWILCNIYSAKIFGEVEFWITSIKIVFIIGIILFTFFTMIGVNPIHDRYGFRYWRESQPFAKYISDSGTGYLHGFLACLIQACLALVGPDYVAMTAGEVFNPRKNMPKAFQILVIRNIAIVLLICFCTTIVVGYNDPDLLAAVKAGQTGSSMSPYVLAMHRMHIPILPDIFNAVMIAVLFSVGNVCVFFGSRTLYGLAQENKAPRIFLKCTRNGAPIYSILAISAFALLALLKLNSMTYKLFSWLMNAMSACILINYAIVSVIFLRWTSARRLQDPSPDKRKYLLDYVSGYVTLISATVMELISGYTVFIKGQWSIATFLFCYIMIPILAIAFVIYKFYKGTKWLNVEDIDPYPLQDEERELKEHESTISDGKLHSRSSFSHSLRKLFPNRKEIDVIREGIINQK